MTTLYELYAALNVVCGIGDFMSEISDKMREVGIRTEETSESFLKLSLSAERIANLSKGFYNAHRTDKHPKILPVYLYADKESKYLELGLGDASRTLVIRSASMLGELIKLLNISCPDLDQPVKFFQFIEIKPETWWLWDIYEHADDLPF